MPIADDHEPLIFLLERPEVQRNYVRPHATQTSHHPTFGCKRKVATSVVSYQSHPSQFNLPRLTLLRTRLCKQLLVSSYCRRLGLRRYPGAIFKYALPTRPSVVSVPEVVFILGEAIHQTDQVGLEIETVLALVS
jgi:hypothetical protein